MSEEIGHSEIEDFREGRRWEGIEEESVKVNYEITSFGADFDVLGLRRRFSDGSIDLPDFQRAFVWNRTQSSLFIESLLIGLPVPGIFLYSEGGTNVLKIVDGQQRLLSLKYFYEGMFSNSDKVFSLSGIKSEFNGNRYGDLSDSARRRLDNSIIHATIIKQDKPEDDNSSTFELYRRINRSGTPLTDQEIRYALYQGKMVDLLRDLKETENWRNIYGTENKRMREDELILRFFALYYYRQKYESPLREFLNKYARLNRECKIQTEDELTDIFLRTISLFSRHLGSMSFRRKRGINVAAFDSMMIGVATRLTKGEVKNQNNFADIHNKLLENKNYDVLISDTTSAPSNVDKRIKMAVEAFRKLK